MKILLIYPYFLDERIHVYDISVPPIGIYTVGSVLKANGYDVEILNWHSARNSRENILATLKRLRPDVIGFSILHANRWGGIEIASLAKSVDPNVHIVFGGIGATFLWRHLLTHFSTIDSIVLGEGEFTFLSLVRCLEANEPAAIQHIQGVAFRGAAGPQRTEPAAPIQNLDQIPAPADHFRFQHVAFTRGCPGDCTFCGSPRFWGHRVRTHSPQYFVDQLATLRNKGIRSFYFSDDTFTFKKSHVLSICRDIIARGLNINWVAISRVNTIDDEILGAMRQAGCTQISYGVESGSETIRRGFNKRIQTRQVQKAFDRTRAFGILPRAYFIYGAPGESWDTIRDTMNLIHDIKPLSATFYILDIFPGTKLYEDFQQSHKVSDDIWLNRVEDIMYFETDAALSKEAILEFGEALRRDFYQNLPAFVVNIELVPDASFHRLHADFYSRLGLTFTHGDFAKIEAIPDREAVAEKLFLKSLSFAPDPRSYMGLGMLYQKQRLFQKSMGILQEGLNHFPGHMDLCICQGINHMNQQNFKAALSIFLDFKDRDHVIPYIAQCYRELGDFQQADHYSRRIQ